LIVSCASNRNINPPNSAAKKATASEMGVQYLLGRGVPQDDSKAFHYFSQAANDDEDPLAQNELAYLYMSGKGTTKDDKKSFYYYQKAANQGLASAQYNLAILYQNGIGTEPNQALAKEWLEKSAAHGFEPARKALSQFGS